MGLTETRTEPLTTWASCAMSSRSFSRAQFLAGHRKIDRCGAIIDRANSHFWSLSLHLRVSLRAPLSSPRRLKATIYATGRAAITTQNRRPALLPVAPPKPRSVSSTAETRNVASPMASVFNSTGGTPFPMLQQSCVRPTCEVGAPVSDLLASVDRLRLSGPPHPCPDMVKTGAPSKCSWKNAKTRTFAEGGRCLTSFWGGRVVGRFS